MGAVESCSSCVSATPGTHDVGKPIMPDKSPAQSASGSDLLKNVNLQLQEKFKSRRAVLDKLDTNKDQKIDRVEFRRFLNKELGLYDAKTIELLFAEIDDDGDGCITLEEFKAHFSVPDDKAAKPGKPAKKSKYESNKSDKSDAQDEKENAPEENNIDVDSPKSAKLDKRRGSLVVEKPAEASAKGENDLVQGEEKEKPADDTKRLKKKGTSKFESNVSTMSAKSGKSDKDAPPKKRRSSVSDVAPDEVSNFKSFLRKHFEDPKQAFSSFDVNDDKSLELEELKQILEKMQYPGDVQKLFDEIDDNKDGEITWEEFKTHVKGK